MGIHDKIWGGNREICKHCRSAIWADKNGTYRDIVGHSKCGDMKTDHEPKHD